MAIPSVKVKIGADVDGLEKGLAKASRNMKTFASGSAKLLAKGTLAVGAAAGVAGAALLAFGRSQANVIDKNVKLARSLGLTHDEFIAMSQVANEAGVSTEKLSGMLGIMQRNIIELGKGTAVQADAFARLGLSISDLQGQSPADQFATIADRLNEIEDPATRTATAMDVLGRSGRGAINMLDGYSEKVQEAAAFQERFALNVSQTDASAIEAANDAFGRVWDVLKGIGNMIAVYVAPLIKHMTDAFFDSGISAETFGNIGNKVMAVFGGMVDGVRIGILGFDYAFQKATQAANLFSSSAIRTLVPVLELMDRVRSLFVEDPTWANAMSTAASRATVAASNAGKAAARTLEDMKTLESTVDRIKRIQDEVKSGFVDNDTGIDAPEGRTAPTGLPPSIGGAAKVTDEMAQRLEALRESLMTEEEEVNAWYARSLETMDWYDAQKNANKSQSLEDRLRLEQEYAAKVAALSTSSASSDIQNANAAGKAILGNLSNVFKKSKGIKVAMAIQDTFAGATRALADHPAPFSYAVAASVVAAGLANVKSIMSASSSGGGGGGGASSAASGSAAASEQQPTQTFAFTIQNDTMGFGESFARQMIDQLNEAQRNGGNVRGVFA